MRLLKKERMYHLPFLCVCVGGGGGGGGVEQVYQSNYFRTHVHCTVVHLSPFEVPDVQVFLSRLPKLTPWKSRLPKFES